MRIYNKWYKEFWWWVLENLIEITCFMAGVATVLILMMLFA